MYLYVSPIWKAPKWHPCFLFESNTIGSIPVFSLRCLWLPSLMVRSLPLLFRTSASSTSLSADTDSLQRCCAPIPRQHRLSEPGEQGTLKQTQTSVLLTKGFPSWVFPSLDVRRMIKKKKKSPEAICRGRTVDTHWLTFCFLPFIGFYVGWGADMRIVDVQSAWGFHIQAWRGSHSFCLFVITCAAGVESKENRT